MDASAAAVQQAYAAWVQALGSIIAIAVAIYVPFQQRRIDLRLRELHYWAERVDVERRMVFVADDLCKFVRRLTDESVPSAGATRIITYYPTIHQEIRERLSALETRNIGDSGHDRIATMRSVLRRLRSSYPATHLSIGPTSTFSHVLATGPIGQDAEACHVDSQQALQRARSMVASLGGSD